ncbi:AAA family ATPase [Butyrivibrio proteoclasticus]|uniref:AAA family ATPase n=1 Tax=Butyrivibrio proteoclasticus TaxID=43305 RepID=UPI0004792AD0|nr:AAA family ATPase [Butyrivibrio proteoclasticus]
MKNTLSPIDKFDRESVSVKGHFNPGNEAFELIANSNYVDKTGLIGIINKSIGTTDNLICISRPRRFGKSYAAQMLCAYYDCTCDSRNLFGKLNISKEQSYENHINKYNVVYLDITRLNVTSDYYGATFK